MVSDLSFTNLVQVSDNNEYDALEDHEKVDITGMVRILPLPILFKEVTAMRNTCSLEQNFSPSEGSQPCA